MYQIILNIPKEFNSSDLRNFFCFFIEKHSFHCFHYRHRPLSSLPEKIISTIEEKFLEANSTSYKSNCCCLIKTKSEYASQFIHLFNNKHWIDKNGNPLLPKCYIKDFEIPFSDTSLTATEEFKSRKNHLQDRKKFSISNPGQNLEFMPPPEMPQGNVGTPTEYFESMIRACKLAPSIISRLGITMTRRKKEKCYSQVPMSYGTPTQPNVRPPSEESIVFTSKGDLIPSSVDFESLKPKHVLLPCKLPQLEKATEEEEDDDDQVEEWERYEAFHNDVTKQGREKERNYEPEIELVWEKGGPGLVFYTDAQYWRAKEGDFDEQTADEWDVDMSGYYGSDSVDIDAASSLSMHQMNKLKEGKTSLSLFKRKGPPDQVKKKKIKGPWKGPPPIGTFEKHTKGVGRRLLESQGWKEGQGLGRSEDGMAFALDNDGQHPCDKKGLGYYEPAKFGDSSKRAIKKQHLISTIYDDPKTTDPEPPLHRSSEPSSLSHYYGTYPILFKKSSNNK